MLYIHMGDIFWNRYAIENANNIVTNYRILRDDYGTGNFLLLATLSGTATYYSDADYKKFPKAKYLVDVIWDNKCAPAGSTGTSHSNVVDASPNDIFSLTRYNDVIDIYPNPATGMVTIELPEILASSSLKIMNALGEFVYEEMIISKTTVKRTINIEKFAKGVYTVSIESKGKSAYKKLVVN